MKVFVNKIMSVWVLTFETEDQVVRTIQHRTLIDAINTANILMVHIDNIDQLPLTQYYKAPDYTPESDVIVSIEDALIARAA